MNTTEENVLPCGCIEKITRDFYGTITDKDMDHCIAHCLMWAGSFQQKAGERMLEDLASAAAAEQGSMKAAEELKE